jgi:hypothetical protein
MIMACCLNAKPAPAPPQAFVLQAAQRFEQLKAWDKAADEYLKIDSSASPADRQAALEGLARVHQLAKTEKRDHALSVAGDLVKTEHWKEAEQVYIELMKSDASAQPIAAERLERISPHWNNRRWPEWIDEVALEIGRALLVLSIIIGLVVLWRATQSVRKTIQFLPISAPGDDAVRQLTFWLESVFNDLRSPAPVLPLAPTLSSSLPFIALPGLAESVPDLDLEVGGEKVPLKAIYDILAKPKARVNTSWYTGAMHTGGLGSAAATVEKRRWFEYAHFSSTRRNIDTTAGAKQDHDLQLFAYAVLIEAAKVEGAAK